VLTRCRVNRLSRIDRRTGEHVRRYEHDQPGDMLHIDVKKLGQIPDGGGWRYVGRAQGKHNREATARRTGACNHLWQPQVGTAFVHTVDNGSAYKSCAWRDACTELGVTPKKTRPYRPQTNGKVERFHRSLTDGWAFGRFYSSEAARRKALPARLHHYNHHRPHTVTAGRPPITRLTNLPGQYS
jgi:transposase InsO family protein